MRTSLNVQGNSVKFEGTEVSMDSIYILYDHGKKVGEVADWKVTKSVPVEKNVLGKIILVAAKNDECSFISPKPVNRRSQLNVIENGLMEYSLLVKAVKGSINVSAEILAKRKLTKK
jgi:hypothetical protein